MQRAGAPVPVRHRQHGRADAHELRHRGAEGSLPPRILARRRHFAIGYTEPEAGTDLASLRTRAVRDGDEYVINGQKIFTSGANQADYIWLAVPHRPRRAEAQGHLDHPRADVVARLQLTPIVTVGGVRHATRPTTTTCACPSTNLVGDENGGWRLITTQLNHERVGLAALGGLAHRLYDDGWLGAGTRPRRRRVIDAPWVQLDLARGHARLEAMKLLNWRMAAATSRRGTLEPGRRVGGEGLRHRDADRGVPHVLEVLGAGGLSARRARPARSLHGELERTTRAAQINTFGGGVNEVQREIVATAGLGMAAEARR